MKSKKKKQKKPSPEETGTAERKRIEEGEPRWIASHQC